MIRRTESDTVWIIHQAAHAYISGQIAEHWTGGGQAPFTPREELLIAAYTHDAGWARVEQQPRINGQGQPRTFTEMDLDEHFTIWQDGIESVFDQNRYAGLLTSLHCTALYDLRLQHVPDPPEVRARIQDFVSARRAWEQRLIASLGAHPRYALAVEPDRLALNLRLLQVWDLLSLLLCMGPVREQTLDDIPMAPGGRSVLRVSSGGPRAMALEPFPLDQPLTLWIDARQVIGGPFQTDGALQQAVSGCAYKPMVFEVEPQHGG